ncbi:MAG: cytidine deaminase [Defluviitaleaceae bacterium]|nr:cytidine deaminase [Defluviitaleaceae bacterium]
MDYNILAKKAIDAKAFAYAPYSNFHVGAALLTKGGKVYTGCNVESAAFSPTCCAERTALVKAVSDGERDFAAIAISGGPTGADYCYPCGVCRQMLYEFGGDNLQIIVVKCEGDYNVHPLDTLLPHGFGAKDLSTRED